jgi:hypothetical protein
MRIFVANASVHTHLFSYRLANMQLRNVSIRPMAQEVLPDDMSDADLQFLLKQKEPYGFIPVSEVKTGGKRPRTSVCFSTDRAITTLAIETLYRAQHTRLIEEGAENRRRMALAATQSATNLLDQQRHLNQIPPDAAVDGFEVKVQELETKPGSGYEQNRPDSEIVHEVYAAGRAADALEQTGLKDVQPKRGRRRK